MATPLLEIKDLKVSVGDKVLLDGINLTVNEGETHVLMGTNGAGKSTLVSAIMGDPTYTLEGTILFNGKDITQESADVRAREGIFLSFQTPQEIPGVTLENFLRTARAALTGAPVTKIMSFKRELAKKMNELDMDPEYADRYINVGFSGGERKKAEILQLLMLDPKLAMLDETDSGLDVDAVKTVSNGIKQFHNEHNSLIIITHNAKIIDGLKVDYVHVIDEKKIVRAHGGCLGTGSR